MHFIIENAHFIQAGRKRRISLMVQNREIRYIGDSVSMYSVMKMEAASFFLTPSHIMYTPNLPADSFAIFKAFVSERLLAAGCGTMITDFSIRYESEIDERLSEKRAALFSSPIDYVIGLRISLSKLTPAIVRKCARYKIPIIFVVVKERTELDAKPWGWIKEASFPSNPIFIPILDSNLKTAAQKRLCKVWTKILVNEKINHLSSPLDEHTPLQENILKKIGLYPNRGILRVGGEVSYNLYWKDGHADPQSEVEVQQLQLAVSVHKGKFLFSDPHAHFHSGFGEELVINQTALFV
ncbi:hypothetical protein [Bacillus sp. FJAT-50079]|uniref:hypothetical protein n=1 Tax=Bacillus sp. FJAT-50079 TaxID=2833577 RepID=UPI001BC9E333|nr:hypothetical protein [Bacillus sp. FJAT-50079]MBS4209770.1 hypothetical protein [Bacillus sp. FJAT-50079]